MNINKIILIMGLSLYVLVSPQVYAQNKNYEAGQKALYQKHYSKALEYFKKAEKDKQYSDASLYWQSYVLYKNKQDAIAKRTVEKLFENHPDSKWIDDAEFLLLENELESSAHNMHELDKELKALENLEQYKNSESIELNEELKLYAIQQLMFKDEAKGMSMIKDILYKSKDMDIKRNALEIMGINESELATTELYDFIQKTKAQQLQKHAVEMLSLRDSHRSNELLLKLFNSKANESLKPTIIQGFIHQGNNEQILELVKKEQNQSLKRQMIEILGVKGASKELKKLLSSQNDTQQQIALINALALSGDSQGIKDFITTSKNNDVKRQAIQSLVMLDDDLGDYLDDLYMQINDPILKNAIISVFAARGKSPKAIHKILKNEKNPNHRRQLLHVFVATGNKEELLKFLESEKNHQTKIEIIHMLGAMGASKELRQLHNNSKFVNLKSEIIQSMGIHGSQQNDEFLNQTYQSNSKEDKFSVISAFMIEGNTAALVDLLKQEEDLEIKKHILQTISNIDPEYILKRLEKSNK